MNRHKSSQVRIIGGKWRGRRLPVLDKTGLRPTPDRVRESVFNWLMFDCQDAHCLDLCAGSGVLGLECMSRGAQSATLVEHDQEVVKQLRKNTQLLSETPKVIEVIQQSVTAFLDQSPLVKFNIVFIDPPYQSPLLPVIVDLLERNQWLAPGAMIYLEHNAKQNTVAIPQSWTLRRESKAGQIRFCLYETSA